LLNCITALEALLGTSSELSFRLSFRVASLLAANDRERTSLFELMRGFYDTRSKLVHGGELNAKHHERLQKLNDLFAIVRRLIKCFITFAANPPPGYNRQSFEEKLDAKLLGAIERNNLRAALRLNQSPIGTNGNNA
jgi:hypothetical protein